MADVRTLYSNVSVVSTWVVADSPVDATIDSFSNERVASSAAAKTVLAVPLSGNLTPSSFDSSI
jgi:hypothetical protein